MTEIELIASLYESQLVIPPAKPKKQYYLAPIGLVGSGKTTVLKPLSLKLNLLRISGDEIRKVILENNLDIDKAWYVGRRLVDKYSSLGYSIAIDADCIAKRTQDSLHDQSLRYNAVIIWVHIQPSDSFIINKLKDYKHTWLYKNAYEAIENYMQRKPLHKDLSKFEFTYSFDTSKTNLEQQIEEASTIIKSRLKI